MVALTDNGRQLSQTWRVAVGLVIQASTALVALGVAGRQLGPGSFSELATLYVVTTTVATGLFTPLEQEIARRMGRERHTGGRDGMLLRRVVVAGAVPCAAFVLAGALAAFGGVGDLQLVAAFCLSLPGYGLCFVSRGVFAGEGRLTRYAFQLAAEGTLRLAGAGVLLLADVGSLAAHGWLIGVAPWIALALSLIGYRRTASAVEPRGAGALRGSLPFLLLSSLAAQAIAGAAPVIAQTFGGPADEARVGAFTAALIVVRVPVFLFTAVQSGALPALSGLAAGGHRAAFAGLVGRVLALMGVLVLLTAAGAALIGPTFIASFFGPRFAISSGTLLLIALAISPYVVAGVLSQAVLALDRNRAFGLAWLGGLPFVLLGAHLPDDAIARAVLGLFLGSAAVSTGLAAILWRAMRHHPSGGQPVAGLPLTKQATRLDSDRLVDV